MRLPGADLLRECSGRMGWDLGVGVSRFSESKSLGAAATSSILVSPVLVAM